MSDLKSFVQLLSTDGEALKEYANNPDGAMDKAGLSDTEKDALRSKDRAKIAAAMNSDVADLQVEVVVTLKIKL